MARTTVCIDGNEATARVAHRLSELVAIYPITPASAMGEHADAWSAAGRPNLWGTVPEVVEMQSEAGAAGALHGAAQKGALATTFTASQGLLLMLPDMYKLAGELAPTVIHVAARTVATHALSIFGDHSDVMAARATGFALLCASSVQQAHDFALVAHAAALRSRVPFLHFFDGFRTSHEVDKIELLGDDDLAALVDEAAILAHRRRGLSPDHPVLRGSAQNPDVFFQAREAANPFYAAVPGHVADLFAQLAARTGRRYGLVDYTGAPDAERVIVLMGSAAGAAEEAVAALTAKGERVGLVTVRLYRPFPSEALAAALPATARAVAVLDRTKEPGAVGEPLYTDVVAALYERAAANGDVGSGAPSLPRVIGGRYGLSSKEFTPAMAKRVFDELAAAAPKRHFTVGIVDDVTRLSLAHDPGFSTEDPAGVRAVFFGVGSDGSVSATKAAVKIIGEHTELFAQGYFVYDSKKSGSVTVSHLRFGARPIRATYLIEQAGFVVCSQFRLLERLDVLARAARGATVLLNCPHAPARVWDELPAEVQQTVRERDLALWVVDADAVARATGLGDRINTVMLPCFFELAQVLPRGRMLAAIKDAIVASYGARGEGVVEQNHRAVDAALAGLSRVPVPAAAADAPAASAPSAAAHHRRVGLAIAPGAAPPPDFVARVTARMLAGEGDLLPVSAMPPDGTFPTGTAKWEKRMLADDAPVWDPALCIDCGKCTIVCPHAALRMTVYPPAARAGAPAGLSHKPFRSKDAPGLELTIQLSPDDCTGCTLCVEACPAASKTDPSHKALYMAPLDTARRAREREAWAFYQTLPVPDPSRFAPDTIKGSQLREPLFEFSGACSGCGETPYLKLLSQLFGDRIVIANATGCSSIFGGSLPTTPWTVNAEGRGPAWANSLFEDNAEFGLGMRLALERQVDEARRLLAELGPRVGEDLARAIAAAQADKAPEAHGDAAIAAQRARVAELGARLAGLDDPRARRLATLAENLVRKSVWIVGGDGWAYDIGSAGLDHVLASGRDVNILVLDTEVYSNTGGQASKATPRGAAARFAASGKRTAKKDLGLIATTYGDVYVAQIALGADDRHTVRALLEADAWEGPSLVIAYSTCIAHGIEMCASLAHQRDAVKSGYWPLYRYHPGAAEHERPFRLDSARPSVPLERFEQSEGRFSAVTRRDAGAAARHLRVLSQEDVDERWRLYEQLSGLERSRRD